MIKDKKIFAPKYRGILLDIVIFFVNLILMRILSKEFINLIRAANSDSLAKITLGIFCAGLFFLQPIGAILKRRDAHRRGKIIGLDKDNNAGCFFFWLALFYFVLTILIFTAADVLITETFLGEQSESIVSLWITLGGFVLCVVNTFFVFRYFSPPRKPPRWKFLLSPQASLIGDICVFLNMICFQILWNIFGSMSLDRPHDVGEFFGRIFLVGFLAMLIYFPPRIFYLAEDINRRGTWLMILLANAPVISRILFGDVF